MYPMDASLATYTLKQAETMLAQQHRLFNQLVDESLALNKAMMDFEFNMDVMGVEQAMTLMFPETTPTTGAKKKSAKPTRAAATKAIAQTPPRKDDLKLISGVGPGLEKKLQDAGITTYAQIAKLTEREITELETHVVKFAGRIKRDDWIGQAKQLMEQ